jgi:protein-tyrosine phosphatase
MEIGPRSSQTIETFAGYTAECSESSGGGGPVKCIEPTSRALHLIREFGNEHVTSFAAGTGEPDKSSGQLTKRLFKEALTTAMINMKLNLVDGKPSLIPIPECSRLYIGSVGCAYDRNALHEHGITHVLCVCNKIRMKYPGEFAYKRIPIEDNADVSIVRLLDEAMSFIRSALEDEGNVLVHCYQGKSRSATICMAFMISEYGYSVQSALEIVRRVRPKAQPNPYFISVLQQFEMKCRQHEPLPANTK